MLRGVTAIPISLQLDPRVTPTEECSASFASDCVLASSLIIALLAPASRAFGIRPEPALFALYLAIAFGVPSLVSVAVWAVRWRSPSPGLIRSLIIHTSIAAIPALLVVGLLNETEQLLALVGVGVMVFAAATSVSASSALFSYNSGRRWMGLIRAASIVLTPIAVLGIAGTIPECTESVLCWAVPLFVAGMGALGARRALLYHVHEKKVYGEGL